ncbi:MAG: hypothetical protein AAGG46_05565, partial [Planctomycetota bacterium]
SGGQASNPTSLFTASWPTRAPPMPDADESRRSTAAALDAAIERNADIVRRGRKSRDRGFLKSLGLSLPVTVDDVKQAFYARAKETHPDHRGDSQEFQRVQQAFDEALRYAETNGKRLPWLGAQLPLYVAQERVVVMVEGWGGKAHIRQLTWLEDTVGEDFAQLADRLDEIDLSGCGIGDRELLELFDDTDGLRYLERLNLSNTAVTDTGVMTIMKCNQLRWVDLRGTDVSYAMRRRIAKLPQVERVEGASRLGELLRRVTG